MFWLQGEIINPQATFIIYNVSSLFIVYNACMISWVGLNLFYMLWLFPFLDAKLLLSCMVQFLNFNTLSILWIYEPIDANFSLDVFKLLLRNSWIYGCRIFIENICDFYVPNNFLFQHIAQRIRQDGGTADASLRREIQTESVQLGISMQHLGAMFFELGRTMMMLRTGLSPVCIICFSFMLCN